MDRLRAWLAIDRETFYDEARVAILGRAFRYPGRDGPDCVHRHLRAEIEAYHVWSGEQRADATGGASAVASNPVSGLENTVLISPCSVPQNRFFTPCSPREFAAAFAVPRS